MELSSPSIKKFSILYNPNLKNFFLKKIYCIFPTKIRSEKISYIFLHFGKFNFLAPRLKAFLYFLKKSFSYISGNGTF